MKLCASIIFQFIIFNSIACVCNDWESNERIDEVIQEADVVFVGTVEGILGGKGKMGLNVIIRPDTLYKGAKQEIIKIYQSPSSCAQQFKKGVKYLVFGTGSHSADGFSTNYCRVIIFHPDIPKVRKVLNRFKI